MLIKTQEDRINFIDAHDNFIGVEHPNSHHGLCDFKWWFTDSEHEIGTFPPREDNRQLKDGSLVNLEKILFDTLSDIYQGELKMIGVGDKTDGHDELENKFYIVAVRLIDEWDCPLWLVMSNCHNGWYSLGWRSNLIPGVFENPEGPFEQEDAEGRRLAL